MRLKLTCQTELPSSEGLTEAGGFNSENSVLRMVAHS